MQTSRSEKILQLIDKSGFGLEIGPSYNPIAAKRDGWNVEIVDHLDAESLRAKYAAWNVDPSAIEDVDYLVDGRGLFAAIGEENRFDFILASHIIEHMPDICQFLIDCERLLKPAGVLSLVVPDKRFCFDVFKPLTTTGQILQAHLERRTRHTPGTVFDAHALHATSAGSLVWPGDRRPSELAFAHSLREAKRIMDEYAERGEYLDVHAWQFVPTSFEMVMQDLLELEVIGLAIVSSFDTAGHEFFVSLRKGETPARRSAADRMALARLVADDSV
ncbi:MAG: methyltransferase domain-containing protein [Myxococcales bacterium]|nr:methyltransferase domain-containing protein [Myxococcales bacterium]